MIAIGYSYMTDGGFKVYCNWVTYSDKGTYYHMQAPFLTRDDFCYEVDKDGNLVTPNVGEEWRISTQVSTEECPTLTSTPPTAVAALDDSFTIHECAILQGKEHKEFWDAYKRSKADEPENDPVNNPSHYTRGGIECIDGLKAAMTPLEFQGFLRGNALKYLWRCDQKGNMIQDLEKSIWYAKKLVEFTKESADE